MYNEQTLRIGGGGGGSGGTVDGTVKCNRPCSQFMVSIVFGIIQ